MANDNELYSFPDIDPDFISNTQQKLYDETDDPTTLDDINVFYKKWGNIHDKHCIKKGPYHTKLYKVYKNKTNESNEDIEHHSNYCIAKVYQLPNKLNQKEEESYKNTVRKIKITHKLITMTNCTKLYGIYYDKQKERIILTMKAYKRTLTQMITTIENKNTKLTEPECKELCYTLLSKLWVLKCHGFLHGDIKPDNIMISHDNQWQLIDFDNRLFIGSSNDHNHYREYNGIRGTYSWSPPEINPSTSNQNKNHFYFASDVWSVGMIILYAIIGIQPYIMSKDEKMDHLKWEERWKYFYVQKLLKGQEYDIDSDKNKGEVWLRNYLIGLFVDGKISYLLWDLLSNYMLVFDPRKRKNGKEIWEHSWFDGYRNLMKKF